MGKPPPIRCRLSPRLFEHLESRILLDGLFDAWVDDISSTTTDVPVDNSSNSSSDYSNNSSSDNSTSYDSSNTDYLTPVYYPPDSPAYLSATPLSNSTILLTWQQYGNAVDGFYVVRCGPDGKHVVAQLSTDARSYLDQNLAPGTNYRYTVTAFNSDGQADSAPASAGTLGDHLTVIAQPNYVTAGQPFSITVDLRNAANRLDTSANSTLTISLASAPHGTTLPTLTVQPTAGIATFSALSLTTSGAYRLAITDGISTTLSRTFIVNPDPSSAHLVLQLQPQPGAINKNLNLYFALNDAFGNLVGSKSNVTLSLLSGPGSLKGKLTVPVKNANATFSTASLTAAGTYTLMASDGSLASAPLQFTQQIAPAATSIPVPKIAPNGYTFGKPLILSTTLKSSPNVPFTGAASLVASDGTTLASASLAANGTVHFPLTLAPGTYTATLQYPGDANHLPATSKSFTFKVTPAPTTTTLHAARPAPGQPLTLTASILSPALTSALTALTSALTAFTSTRPADTSSTSLPSFSSNPTAATLTGTLAFYDGKTLLAILPLDPTLSASLTLPTLPPGTHSFTVLYSGDPLTQSSRTQPHRLTIK